MDKLMKMLGSSEIRVRVPSAMKNAGLHILIPAAISTIWSTHVFNRVDSAIWGT
jgi:hypothetical protein